MKTFVYIILTALILLGAGAGYSDIIDDLTITPQSNLAGEYTVYSFKFTAGFTQEIPKEGYFRIIFGPDFNLDQVVIAASTDQETLDGGLTVVSVSGDTVLLDRNGATTSPAGGDTIQFSLAMVGNPLAGSYQIELHTLYVDISTIIDEGTSAPFLIENPTDISSFNLYMTPQNPKAGQSVKVVVADARDSNLNLVDGVVNLAFDNGTLNDHAAPNGQLPNLVPVYVSNGAGYAWQTFYKAENNVQLRGTVDGTSVTQLTSVFDVAPGDLSEFVMTGVPDSVSAGNSFSGNSINVALYDSWENAKTDYQGQLYFTSSDPAAQFAYNSTNPFLMFPPHSGSAVFSGDLFDLRRAGNQTITVTNETILRQSDKILVTAGPIISYEFQSLLTEHTGKPL